MSFSTLGLVLSTVTMTPSCAKLHCLILQR